MELKDWLTLLISVLALMVASYSLWLTWRRDRRDVNAKQPAANIDFPILEGQHPWEATITVRNRDDVPLRVDKVLTRGDNAYQIGSDPDGTPVGLLKWDLGPRDFIWLDIKRVVGPGEIFTKVIRIGPTHGKRIGNAVPTILYMDITRQDAAGTTQRLAIRRIANP